MLLVYMITPIRHNRMRQCSEASQMIFLAPSLILNGIAETWKGIGQKFKNLLHDLVLELDALAARRVNHATSVGTPLSLVLLLGESFALCDNQFGMRAVGIVV